MSAYVCPACGGEFPRLYFREDNALSLVRFNKAYRLARLNFERHVEKCKTKHGWIFCDGCCAWFSNFAAYAFHLDEPDNNCTEE